MSINPDRDLYLVTFSPTPGFPMDVNQTLHLILTNPVELQVALQEDWPLAVEIAGAIRVQDYHILYADDVGKQCLKDIEAWIPRNVLRSTIDESTTATPFGEFARKQG